MKAGVDRCRLRLAGMSMAGAGCVLVACGQVTIANTVVDEVSRQPLEFVSIGIPGSTAFTLSRPDGTFTLALPDDRMNDTISFLLIGREAQKIPVAELMDQHHPIGLVSRAEELPLHEVVGGKLEERELGVRTHHALFNYLMETTRPDEVPEAAQVIDLGTTPVHITAANIFISWADTDSATFRVNFRAFDGEQPREPLVQRALLRKVALERGWTRLDLSGEGIVLKGVIVVSLELLPRPGAARTAISYGIKFGGKWKGLDRRSALDPWNEPPHRYSINVSAVVPAERPVEPTEPEEPFVQMVDSTMYSPAVQDSFALAVELPEGFDPLRPGGYAVVYLLDANAFLEDVVRACHRAERKGSMPPVIVVGIGYRDFVAMDSLRQRDYLFPPALPGDSLAISGGGEAFLAFIDDQLVPYIDRRFPTDTMARILAGHSFGGYFSLFALQRSLRSGHSPFAGFVAASPSLEYHDGYLLEQFGVDGNATTGRPSRVFMSLGGREGEGAAALQQAMTSDLCTVLGTQEGVILKRYPRSEHMDTALPSFTDGIQWLLSRP